jgi:excisionase family DNA binding protein
MSGVDGVVDREYKLARALVEAHVPPEVAPLVLDALDGWHGVVDKARAALQLVELERGATPLSVVDAARVIGCSPTSVYRMIQRGDLPEVRVGRSIRVPVEAVQQYRDRNTRWHERPARAQPRDRRPLEDQQTVAEHPWLEAI